MPNFMAQYRHGRASSTTYLKGEAPSDIYRQAMVHGRAIGMMLDEIISDNNLVVWTKGKWMRNSAEYKRVFDS
jgi:hypothetical protein